MALPYYLSKIEEFYHQHEITRCFQALEFQKLKYPILENDIVGKNWTGLVTESYQPQRSTDTWNRKMVLKTSPRTHQKSYPKFWNPRTTFEFTLLVPTNMS